MDAAVIAAPVDQSVDQPRIPVIGEDHRLVGSEHHVELPVGHPVRVLAVVLQSHQVYDVDEPHLEIRNVLAQQIRGGQCLQGRHIAGGGQHDIGVAAVLLGTRPLPDAQSAGAMCHRLIHRQEIRVRLLAGDHDVDVLA